MILSGIFFVAAALSLRGLLYNAKPCRIRFAYASLTAPSTQTSSSEVDKVPGRGYAIASLVMGILALCLGGLLFAILGIVFGKKASREARSVNATHGMATAGTVCSWIALIFSILVILFVVIVIAIGYSYYVGFF